MVLWLCAALLLGCGRQELLISGRTMGTTYHIKVIGGAFTRAGGLQKAIDARLQAVNDSMSIYLADSEISRFNRRAETGSPVAASSDLRTVLKTAREIYDLSGGAWDGTLKPVVDLWGFGSSGTRRQVPEADAIARSLARVGFDRLVVSEAGLDKKVPDLSLDLGSIAKGYGVDAVSALLRKRGFTDFLVEIGGEVLASGTRIDGKHWRLGINTPLKDTAYTEVYKVLFLKDRALATSGDYRNFFEIEGERFAHVIDPRTGYPVTNGVVSASVVADTCTLADGLATAVMVMGAPAGIALIDRLEGVEGLVVVRSAEGRLIDFASRGFPALTADPG